MSVWFLFLFAFVTATATAALVTPRIRRIAEKAGFVDQIDDRRMHAEPKPRAGGLAIYLPASGFDVNYSKLALSKAGKWDEFMQWLNK